MFKRAIEPALRQQASQYPVVTMTGPRQSGKTTLTKQHFHHRPYYNLENPDTKQLILSDPRRFIDQIDLHTGVIIDEIQHAPALLSYIQTRVDADRVPGSFILTGSHQLQLNAAITQSLAGRTSLLELLPLSIKEIGTHSTYTVDDYLLNGFYPAIYQHHLDPTLHARNYIKTYVERDVRQLINLRDLNTFQRFLKLCAARISSTLNKENLANETGVSQTTISHWLSILEASYIVFQLPPYFENFGKRITKAPKLYFQDVGLASYLLDIRSTQQMNIDKYRGGLFENMVIGDLLKYRYNQGQDANLYYYRDSNQNEVDLIIKEGNQLIPIEIKSSATFNTSLLKNLKRFREIAGKDRVKKAYLVYAGQDEAELDGIHLINYRQLHKHIDL